ncbi:MAG TPA: hypothetical protein VEI46_00035 [Thermodesulfovibrionales bacterium]|nr:hypothetical protein [Thermodesulfovibrionales bacterium]
MAKLHYQIRGLHGFNCAKDIVRYLFYEEKISEHQKKANGKIREIAEGRMPLELPLLVTGIIESLPEEIRDMAQEAGLLLMSAAMTAECEMKAAPKNTKIRYGQQTGGAKNSALFIMISRRCS